jgi:hypothetical protein
MLPSSAPSNCATNSVEAALVNKVNEPSVTTLSQTISNPPTQGQVQNVQNKLNELLIAIEP